MKRANSELFAPYRFVGVVTSNASPCVRTTFIAKKSMISLLCPIDNVIIQYNGMKLRAVGMSEPVSDKISVVAASSSCVYAAYGSEIAVMPFCRDISRIIKIEEEARMMIMVGDQLLVVDSSSGISVIDVEEDFEVKLYLDGDDEFQISAICHPSTYLNKIVVGSKTGRMRLINFRTGKVVHEYKAVFNSEIRVIEQSTALDVAAIGLANGQVVLFNLKTEQIFYKYSHDASITGIAFRDDGEEDSMITADLNGTLAVWDLDKKELIGKITNVHKSHVNLLYVVPGERIMITASTDNSLRTWIFDGADGLPRQLVQLEGHAKAITSTCFSTKNYVLSSGLDGSVRKYDVTSLTMRQKLGTSALISKSKAKKKNVDFETMRLENVVDMAVGWQKESSWDNVVCLHKNTLEVTTWTTAKNCAGSVIIKHDRFKNNASLIGTVATTVCLSPCGNYVFVGYSSGHLDKFNVQSGRHIHTFTENIKTKKTKVKMMNHITAHDAPITCLTVDHRGNELASGCESGIIKFWSLTKNRCVIRLKTPSLKLRKSVTCETNNLIAVSCLSNNGESSVVIIDTICHRIVRSFKKVGRIVTSIGFSADGKWLLVADSDCHIRVFEVTTSNLIDVILFAKPCVSLSFNTTGEFLATAHEGEKAIYIWANKSLFLSHVNIRALPEDYLPSWERNTATVCIDDDDDKIYDEEMRKMRELQIDDSLISYSGLAPSRWRNLSDLTLIKERNKPKEAPRKIKQAPFFLTAAPTLEGFEFDKNTMDDDIELSEKEVAARRSFLELESVFTSQLKRANNKEYLLDSFASLKSMSISAIDFQIRSMSPEVLPAFFRMLLEVLKLKRDFELVQSYMAAAMKIHRNELWRYNGDSKSELDQVLKEMYELEQEYWNDFEDILIENTSMVHWIKNALI